MILLVIFIKCLSFRKWNLNLKPKVFRKINLNLNLKFCREPDLNLNLILKRRTYQQSAYYIRMSVIEPTMIGVTQARARRQLGRSNGVHGNSEWLQMHPWTVTRQVVSLSNFLYPLPYLNVCAWENLMKSIEIDPVFLRHWIFKNRGSIDFFSDSCRAKHADSKNHKIKKSLTYFLTKSILKICIFTTEFYWSQSGCHGLSVTRGHQQWNSVVNVHIIKIDFLKKYVKDFFYFMIFGISVFCSTRITKKIDGTYVF